MARIDMAEKSLTVCELADMLGAEVCGTAEGSITAVAALDSAGPADLTFAINKRYAARLGDSAAAAAVVSEKVDDAPMPLLIVDNVDAAVARVLAALSHEERYRPQGIDPSARISPQAELADDVAVGPGVTIGPGTKIDSWDLPSPASAGKPARRSKTTSKSIPRT